MSVEAFGTIGGLNTSWPLNSDLVAEGDDHIRGLKTTLKTVFPNFGAGAVAATPAQINFLTGVTSAVQTQLDAKAPINAPAFTGGLTAAGVVSLPATTSIGTVSDAELATLDGVTSPLQAQINAKAPLASPALTGTPTAPTAPGGTNTTQLATTAFVQGVAFGSALPGQLGQANKVVRTDGTAANWDYQSPPETVHTGSGPLVVGRNNVLQTPGIAMTFPALTVGDEFTITDASDTTTCTVDFAAMKIRNRTDLPGVMTIVRGQSFTITWMGATLGWV